MVGPKVGWLFQVIELVEVSIQASLSPPWTSVSSAAPVAFQQNISSDALVMTAPLGRGDRSKRSQARSLPKLEVALVALWMNMLVLPPEFVFAFPLDTCASAAGPS